jgi:hypothetical protein
LYDELLDQGGAEFLAAVKVTEARFPSESDGVSRPDADYQWHHWLKS